MYGIDDNADVCHFIDKYITCAIPADEGKLRDIVLLLQKHSIPLIAGVTKVADSISHILLAMRLSYLSKVMIPLIVFKC